MNFGLIRLFVNVENLFIDSDSGIFALVLSSGVHHIY